MKVRPLICPRCGADLSPARERNAYRCSRCGLNVALDFTSVEGVSKEERAAILERDRVRAERDRARFERDRERAERDKVRAPFEAEMRKQEMERDKVRASIEAEIQEKQLEREREKERNDNRLRVAVLGLPVALMLLCLFMANASSIGSFFTGDIAVPASSSDLTGISYSDVEQRFADAGFTNIECKALNDLDLVSGFFNGDGSVDHVTINGEEDFSSSSHYPSDATIRIYYHSHPD